MLKHVAQTSIAVPVERAFDTMADARNETRWNAQVSRSVLVGDGPIHGSSVFKTTNRGAEYTATITTYERPDTVCFDVEGARMAITASFSFSEADGRTELTAEFEFSPRGVMKLMFPLMGPLIRRDIPKQFARFRDMCEAEHQLGGGADRIR